jgi:hypothetical protein
MSLLLNRVENLLGYVYEWPAFILKFLYIDPPAFVTVRALICFFYGNGVPVEMAVQLFQACNDRANIELTEHFSFLQQVAKFRM